ncbi:MAG TPA: hypothetical protein VH854_10035 [Thermoanaerobaculia bacterium]|nr:hypothetical protein [Thermoanaerobaculia bacterium]
MPGLAPAQDATPTPGPANATKPDATAATPGEKETRERDTDAPKGEDPLARELDALLRGAGKPADFWIDVTWPTSTNQLTAARVWGTGVGTWNRAAQFRLSKDDVRKILREIRQSRFGAYPLEVHEEEKKGDARKPGEREESELYGRIIVNAGDVTHLVRQLGDRPDHELEDLAKTVIRICEKPAAQGQRIPNLDEGLRRVSDGKLAPEAFEVLARRKVDKPDPGPGAENWMLRINGRRAVDRDLTRKPAVERILRLTDQEMKTLASLLRDARAGTLPQSLWAPLYTTLRVQVLNQARNIQARQFVGMTPEAHGAQQAAFDKVFAWCVKTHDRVKAKGRVLPPQKWEREGERENEREGERKGEPERD